MLKTDTLIRIAGLEIHEPITVLTNIIICVMCFVFFFLIKRNHQHKLGSTLWRFFFLCMALSSFIGAFKHGFLENKMDNIYLMCWLPMQAITIAGNYYAQRATAITALKDSSFKRLFINIATLQLILFIPAVFIFQNYTVVTINTALALIPVMVMHFTKAKHDRTYLWMAYGIAILFLTAFVHTTKFSLHRYFNYLDISHVLLMITFCFFYIGIHRKEAF